MRLKSMATTRKSVHSSQCWKFTWKSPSILTWCLSNSKVLPPCLFTRSSMKKIMSALSENFRTLIIQITGSITHPCARIVPCMNSLSSSMLFWESAILRSVLLKACLSFTRFATLTMKTHQFSYHQWKASHQMTTHWHLSFGIVWSFW
jgi:hypothetical protein